MARYEANADFQRDYYKRRKLAGRSPGNDDEVSIICFPHIEYCTGGLVRSENEARILYTVEKGFVLQSKSEHSEKIRRRATRGEITFLSFSNASRGTAWASTLQICFLRLCIQRATKSFQCFFVVVVVVVVGEFI